MAIKSNRGDSFFRFLQPLLVSLFNAAGGVKIFVCIRCQLSLLCPAIHSGTPKACQARNRDEEQKTTYKYVKGTKEIFERFFKEPFLSIRNLLKVFYRYREPLNRKTTLVNCLCFWKTPRSSSWYKNSFWNYFMQQRPPTYENP